MLVKIYNATAPFQYTTMSGNLNVGHFLVLIGMYSSESGSRLVFSDPHYRTNPVAYPNNTVYTYIDISVDVFEQIAQPYCLIGSF